MGYLAAALAPLVMGCGDGGSPSTAKAGAGGALGEDWQTNTAYSPTGTTLVDDVSGQGYAVVDEVCGARDDLAYASRFQTPMFRDLAVDGTTGWAVDGSHLWVLDLSDPAAPKRHAVMRLHGTPIAVHLHKAATATWLWVASIDALYGYPLLPDGTVDLTAVQVALQGEGARVMDVEGEGDLLYVARGADGVAAVPLSADGAPGTPVTTEAAPYAASVDIAAGRLVVAACDQVHAFQVDTKTGRGYPPVALDPEVDFAVPLGVAKDVEVDGNLLYISAGAALLAFRIDAGPGGEPEVRYLGYYKDDSTGFYVNSAASSQGFLYLAAGDQSVRALDVQGVVFEEGVPVTWETPAEGAALDDAVEVELPSVTTVHQMPKDPIAVVVAGETLFSLGNFRYVGERTVEVIDIAIPGWLRPVGRYVQPNLGIGLTAVEGALVAHTATGDHTVIELGAAPVKRETFSTGFAARGSATTADGLFVYGTGPVIHAATDAGAVIVDTLVAGGHDVHGLALDAERAYVADAVSDAILVVDRKSGEIAAEIKAHDGFLGEAELAWDPADGGTLWAYDRVVGEVRLFAALASAAPVQIGRLRVGLCEAYDLAGFYTGAVRARAQFVAAASGMAMSCPRQTEGGAALLHLGRSASGPSLVHTTTLPAQTYTDVVVVGDLVVLSAFDNNRYQSAVAAYDAMTGALVHEVSFLGHANAVSWAGGQFWVLDGDFGLRALGTSLELGDGIPLTL
jgi:hypothetical protein